MLPDKLTYPDNVPENLKAVLIVDLRKNLPTNPKYTWESLKGLRDINQLTTIVMHHDALTKASTAGFDDRALAARIATSHIKSTKNIPGGDAGFPYHIWIRGGIVYLCNNFDALTYGVASNNGYTVHICVSGDYANVDSLTDPDRKALYAAYFFAKQFLPYYTKTLGHKEIAATACPGYSMTTVRKDLAAIELDMSMIGTPNDNVSRIFSFKARFDDLYNKAVNPKDPNQAAAQAKLFDLMQSAIDKGIYTP